MKYSYKVFKLFLHNILKQWCGHQYKTGSFDYTTFIVNGTGRGPILYFYKLYLLQVYNVYPQIFWSRTFYIYWRVLYYELMYKLQEISCAIQLFDLSFDDLLKEKPIWTVLRFSIIKFKFCCCLLPMN